MAVTSLSTPFPSESRSPPRELGNSRTPVNVPFSDDISGFARIDEAKASAKPLAVRSALEKSSLAGSVFSMTVEGTCTSHVHLIFDLINKLTVVLWHGLASDHCYGNNQITSARLKL